MNIIDKIFGTRNIGLALGAGGARGLAHIGVIQALDELNYKIVALSGASMGAIVAAMFAFYPHWSMVQEKLFDYFKSHQEALDEFEILKNASRQESSESSRFKSIKSSMYKLRMYGRLIADTPLLKSELLTDLIYTVLPDKDIEEANLPLTIVVYDILSEKEVRIRNGAVRDIVVASCSIPGIFPPVKKDDMLLVDSGAISPVPVSAVKSSGVKKIVAVDVSPKQSKHNRYSNGLDIMLNVLAGATQKIKEMELRDADIVIQPQIGGLEWWRFEYYQQIKDRGYKAAMERLTR
ncbi:hypothetical protein DRQ33_06780 [bacterium]|nr:MAG: hypothetical protein DRQ33_06780 [bacterium]